MSKPALHFTHANGIPSGSYQKFFQFLNKDFDVKAIPMIGLDPHYPVEYRWEALVDQVISDIEQQFPATSDWFRAFFWLFTHTYGGL